MLDLDIPGWLTSRLKDPWAKVQSVVPLMGMVYADIPALEAAIADTPELFIDGTPVYVTTITYDTPVGDDPVVVEDGDWVVVYSLKPFPLLIPSEDHLQHWIDTYDLPDGGLTWVGTSGETTITPTTVVGGSPAPTSSLNVGGTCAGTSSTAELDLPLHPTSLVSGDPADYSDIDLADVASV